jgi:two-component system cell cycle sensor histidine kinase/response regulator CckA
MNKSLNILHVEDSEDDCEVVRFLLQKEWTECTLVRVESKEQLIEALQNKTFDLILADYRLPGFSGLEALEIVRSSKSEIPFIFVSGMMGEEKAIISLQNGATDYVLKDNLNRLVPAIRRALIEAKEHLLNRKLQQRLLEASRLQAVSTLSTGISHDFNNILTIIHGHAALLKIERERPDRIVEISDTISSAARRASDIVRQLMAFAQQGEGHAVVTDLNRRIREILNRLKGTLPDGIRIYFEPAKELPNILMDRSQLETILINLVANSIDSMPEGGSIKFSLSVIAAGELAHLLPEEDEQRYICLKVADTGKGMDSSTRQHIFEPFYTTKQRGRGTGMGLPAAYGLMLANNGWIDVKSEPDQGTVMSLFFPVSNNCPVMKEAGALSLKLPRGNRETILVIEDEIDVSVIVESVLTRDGYNVLLASDHDEALMLFKANQKDICLAFSDIGLPKIDGITICSELKTLKPELKIILSSGYSPNDFKERMDVLGIDAFLSKPYDHQNLSHYVQKTLENGKTNGNHDNLRLDRVLSLNGVH